MPNVGPWEIILLLLLAVLLFGAKRLPEIGRSVGQGMREFKNSVSSHTNDVRDEVDKLSELVAGTTTDVPAELVPLSSIETTATTPTREHDTI